MASNDLTRLHFRADTPDAYATALLRLITHARSSNDDFAFGPVKLSECERDGLTLVGPDLTQPVSILAAVPGLAQLDA